MTYCRMSCLLIDWKRLTLIALHKPKATTRQEQIINMEQKGHATQQSVISQYANRHAKGAGCTRRIPRESCCTVYMYVLPSSDLVQL